MYEFVRVKRLPPYVFAVVNQIKMEARRRGEDIVDLGMETLISLRPNTSSTR